MATQEGFFNALERGLSSVRFSAYKATAGEPKEETLARYIWNMALGEALYPSMHCLEVALRNTLHHEATVHFGTDRWLDPANAVCVLLNREKTKVNRAKDELIRHGKPTTPDRLVAELSFGFWTSLLSGQYEQPLLVKIIKPAFPGMPKRIRTRGELAKRFNAIRRFRNRIFHHEPIWKRPDLDQDHRGILEAIGWICTEIQQTAMVLDRFPEVKTLGPGHYLTKLAPLALTPTTGT